MRPAGSKRCAGHDGAGRRQDPDRPPHRSAWRRLAPAVPVKVRRRPPPPRVIVGVLTSRRTNSGREEGCWEWRLATPPRVSTQILLSRSPAHRPPAQLLGLRPQEEKMVGTITQREVGEPAGQGGGTERTPGGIPPRAGPALPAARGPHPGLRIPAGRGSVPRIPHGDAIIPPGNSISGSPKSANPVTLDIFIPTISNSVPVLHSALTTLIES